MMTGAATMTAPTTALLQMLTKNMLTLTTMTLQTAATNRCSDLQAMCARDCTQCVYANACTVHNVKLLSEDRENFEG